MAEDGRGLSPCLQKSGPGVDGCLGVLCRDGAAEVAGRGGRLPARATGKDPRKGVSPVCPAAVAWEERRGKDMGHLRRVRMNQVD